MSLAKSKRVLVAVAAGATALTLAFGLAAPANAYIDNCDDPLVLQVEIVYVNGRPTAVPTVVNSVTGKPLSTWDEKHILNPDGAKAADGYFAIPVPKKFQGRKTKVSIQFVNDSPDGPLWMGQAPSHRPWGTGDQVWLYKTITPKSSVQVGIPNYDPKSAITGFKFEIIFKTKVKGKRVSEAFLVEPKNQYDFNQYEHQSNGLTFLDLRA